MGFNPGFPFFFKVKQEKFEFVWQGVNPTLMGDQGPEG